MPHSLSLVILCLNEEPGLRATYNTYKKVIIEHKLDHEIFIVNDGSTDNTGGIADEIKKKDPSVRVFHNKKPHGMGYGYKLGLQQASKEYYMYTCAYDNVPEKMVGRFLECIGTTDITLGYIANPQYRVWLRRFFSAVFHHVMKIVSGLDLKYFNGMDLVRTECLKEINIRSNRYTFQAECIMKLINGNNCTYREIPLVLKAARKSKSKAVNLINFIDVPKFFLFLFYDLCILNKKK
jgi:glycosyltransferase involved in cell wall biosynthesis